MHPNGMLSAVLAGVVFSSLTVWILKSENVALESLAQAERAFSKRCGEVGFRQSFLDNFAADGVFFAPMPKNCQENLSKLPVEPKPTSPPFEWAPATADVSVAGDMGYTTGPVRYNAAEPGKPARYGWYFSVWRREGQEPWKVIVDLGIQPGTHPLGDPAEVAFAPAPDFRTGRKTFSNAETAGEDSLRRAEQAFGEKVTVMPMAEAILATGTPNVRVHRNGHLPALNRRSIGQALEGIGPMKVWKTLGAGVAKSGDFGYTYGRYEAEGTDGKPRTGYWVRVWKRDEGPWRLVADVANEG